MKRALGLILAISMLVSLVPVGFAATPAEFYDFPTGWSKEAMTAAVNNGLLYGFDNGEIRPKANLTRAEMAAVITRSFGAVTKADISAFTDVSPSSWYYDSISKAVKMGALNGASATEMLPENPITREELFTVFGRVLVLTSPNADVLNKFNDYNELSLWAKAYTIALVERGYVNGDNLGNLNPKAYITREEFAQIMHNAIRTYIFESGTYTADMEGITVIRAGEVTIKNLTNTSDLVVGDGAGKGNIYIENVNVGKRLLARGGTITLKNTVLGEKVVVNNVNGTTHFNNYRDEKVFDNIVENTTATFLKRISVSTGGDSTTPSKTKYKVNFYKDDGSLFDTIKVVKGKVIGSSKLPAVPEIKGYEGKWINKTTGEEVTKDTIVNNDMVVVPSYTIIEYKLYYKYIDENGVEKDVKFIYQPLDKYTIEDLNSMLPDKSYKLPTVADITEPVDDDKEFVGWYDNKNGYGYKITEINENNLGNYTLYAIFKPIGVDTVKIEFYNGFETSTPIADIDIEKGKTLDESGNSLPDAKGYADKGYEKNSSIASVYDSVDFVHETIPEFYYVKDNKLVKFDENVKITEDTKVYLLNKFVSFGVTLNDSNFDFKVGAYYNEDTRVMDSFKDVLADGKKQLIIAKDQNAIPQLYYDMKDKAFNLLEDKNIIDNNKNIKKLPISVPLNDLVKTSTVENMIHDHIEDVIMGRDSNNTDVYSFIKNMNNSDLDKYNIDTNDIPLSISKLSYNNKFAFAEAIFKDKKTFDVYQRFIDGINNESSFKLSDSDVDKAILKNIAYAIAKLDYNEMMEQSADNGIVKMLIKLIGEDEFIKYFEQMRDSYADGMIKAIDNGDKEYTTKLTLKINPIEIVNKFYADAQKKVADKLSAAGIKYGKNDNENKYLYYLVEEHDVIDSLFDYNGLNVSDELTGYSLKDDVMDYYDYMLSLAIVTDDALTYYNDKAEFNAVYDLIINEITNANDKLNEILEAYIADGTLPSQIQSVVENIKQINDLIAKFESQINSVITKYLESSINDKIQNGELKDDDKFNSAIDFIFGKENPRITVDAMYEIFFNYDDKLIDKLKEVKDNEKLKKAIDKFESTSIGKLFKSDSPAQGTLSSVYEMIEKLCDEGVDGFKVDASKVTDIDEYKVSFEGITFILKRQYQ